MIERAWLELVYADGRRHVRPVNIELTDDGLHAPPVRFTRAPNGTLVAINVRLRDEPLMAPLEIACGLPWNVAGHDWLLFDDIRADWPALRAE